MRKEKETHDLANGINFQYTSPYMSDNHSIVKIQNLNDKK